MSLINDMLKDLDARRTQPAFANLAALPGAGTASDGFNVSRNTVIWAAAGACLLGSLAVSVPLLTDYFAVTTEDSQTVKPAMLAYNTPTTLDLPEEKRFSPGAAIASANRPVPVSLPPAKDTVTSHHDNVIPHNREETRTPEPATDSSITVTPSPDSRRSEHGYHAATRAAAAGNDLHAIDLLERLLLDNSGHHDARLLLASLHIRQQQQVRAISILKHGLSQHPDHAGSARLLARLLVSRGQHAEAVVYLESALGGATQDADYHALLAGLYQHSGNPAGAARHYTAALSLNPGRGEWWMGLGISREQSGNASAAGAAYRKALDYPLNAALQDYISTRLQLINRNDPSSKATG
jgi:MSHA biogenesis protein MshN